MQEWESLSSDEAWANDTTVDTLRNKKFRKYVVLLVGAYAGPLQQRIINAVERMPVTLLRMTCAKPSDSCGVRHAVAKAVVDTPPGQLEHNAKMLMSDYPQAMHDAALTGKLDVGVHKLLLAIRHTWRATVQEQESENSVITKMSDLAPYMGIRLPSDRCKIKKVVWDFQEIHAQHISLQSRQSALSHVKLKAKALESTLNVCVENHGPMSKAVDDQHSRWADPDHHAASSVDVSQDKVALTPALKWASRFNPVWNRAHRISSDECLVFQFRTGAGPRARLATIGGQCDAWLCVDKYRSLGCMWKGRIQSTSASDTTFTIIRPFVLMTSVDVFAMQFQAVCESPDKILECRLFSITYDRSDFVASVETEHSKFLMELTYRAPRVAPQPLIGDAVQAGVVQNVADAEGSPEECDEDEPSCARRRTIVYFFCLFMSSGARLG